VVSGPVVGGPVVPGRPHRLRSVVLWSGGLVVLLAAFCFVCRAPLLRAAANAWMVNDPPVKADAIVVLGGGAQFRSFEAIRLYQAGLAPAILVMNSELRATDRLALTIPEAELVRRVLLTNAVPAEAIQLLGTNLTSTFEEALTVRAWMKTTGAKAILIPTDVFHTRRVRWIFRKEFRGAAVEFRVVTVPPGKYSATNWWRFEEGLIAFQNEVIKFAYYHLKY